MTAADGKQRMTDVAETEQQKFKALSNPKENLRDHMNDLELIFTMFGEASTTEIAKKRDAQGFPENQKAANAGGTIAGDARKSLEERNGNKISTSENHRAFTDSKKRISRKKSEF